MQDVHFGQETYQTVPLRRCNVSIQTEKDYLHVCLIMIPRNVAAFRKRKAHVMGPVHGFFDAPF